MRLLYPILFVVIVGLVLAQFLPWWSIALAGAGAGFIFQGHYGKTFLAAFLGALFLWAGTAIIITQSTGSDLGDRFARLMGLPANAFLLAVVAGVLAGLISGFAGLTGDAVGRIIKPKNQR